MHNASQTRGHVRLPNSLRRSQLDPRVQALWAEIDDQAREAESVTMTVAALAERMKRSVSTIRRYAAALVKAGYLRVSGQRGGSGSTTWTPLARARPIDKGLRRVIVTPARNVSAPRQSPSTRMRQPRVEPDRLSQHPAREENTRARAGGIPTPSWWSSTRTEHRRRRGLPVTV